MIKELITEIGFHEIGGFKAGHAQDEQAATGCTTFLFEHCSPAGVDIRGGGPASRETPLLNPVMAAEGVHGILLSGGSAYGLDAAGGVMRYLEEQGIGVQVGSVHVPLVCQSDIFDLEIGDSKVRPDTAMAYQACENASNAPLKEGNYGVGQGCTVGKLYGMDYAMKTGIGTFAIQIGNLKIGAAVAVNALGDVFDLDTGVQIAGLLNQEKNGFLSTEEEILKSIGNTGMQELGNTTIGVVITNAKFSKAEMNKIAAMAQNGYVRTIRPIHTTADGDAVYAVSVGEQKADLNIVGTLASYVTGKAVNKAVRLAKRYKDYPAALDF